MSEWDDYDEDGDGEPTWVLRDLPGVEDVEKIMLTCLDHPNPKWAPARDEAEALAKKVAFQLFGIKPEDLEWSERLRDLGFNDEREWRRAFREPWGPVDVIELGWDISNGQGAPLLAAELFQPYLVAVGKSLLGHAPGAPVTDQELDTKAEYLSGNLSDEVAAWRRRR